MNTSCGAEKSAPLRVSFEVARDAIARGIRLSAPLRPVEVVDLAVGVRKRSRGKIR